MRSLIGTSRWLWPIDRVDQCVSPLATDSSSVLAITDSTCSSVIFRGVPCRGWSVNPSSRWTTSRGRHFATVSRASPNSAATSYWTDR
jgi:hypothetical protein